MKVCSNCGSKGNNSFCTSCGGRMVDEVKDQVSYSSPYATNPNSSYQTSSPASTYPQQSQFSSLIYPTTISLPAEYQPISPMGYIGYVILFLFPVIGFIMSLVFAFGGTQNVNVRNLARATLIIPFIVILLIYLIVIGLAFLGYGLLNF